MEIISLKLVKGHSKELNDLQKVLEAAPEFSLRTTGVLPESSAAQNMISALPPNKSYDDKFVFILTRENVPVGCADLIRGYPDAATAWIGLLLIDESIHGRGLGRFSYEKIEQQIRSWTEIEGAMISVVATNSAVVTFWQKMGFFTTGEKKPYKHGTVESEVILMRKVLA